ncbi:MAG: hypothetical protein DDT21_01997 [Syntrophomonadaceae bacterium]|nr:hypothetical protein [Bacillota bacterium]
MAKTRQHGKQDAYTANLLISLLIRFPEILSINFNMPQNRCKFTFMLSGRQEREEVLRFRKTFKDALETYINLTGEYFSVKIAATFSHRLNLLEITSNTTFLSLEAIQLICGLVATSFGESLLKDAECQDSTRDDDLSRHEEIIDYLLSHSVGSRQDNLFAFREAGRVYVYDK